MGPPRRFRGRVCAFAVIELLCGLLLAVLVNAQAPSLPSWNEGSSKQAIMAFVKEVTDESNPKYVHPETASPHSIKMVPFGSNILFYTQAVFALDPVYEPAPRHPEWNQQEPFEAVLANDPSALGRIFRIGLGNYRRRRSHRDEHRSLRGDCEAVAGKGKTPQVSSVLHGPCLSTDARSPVVSARQRVQDLYRNGRRSAGRPHIQ